MFPVDVILRSAVIYLFIVIAIRLFGKREIAQLSIIDLVFILLISNAVQNAMVGQNSTLLGGVIAAGTLFGLHYLLGTLFYRSKRISELFQGDPIMLVYQGKIIKKHLVKAKISQAELDEAIREHGVEELSEVDLAVLEIDGNISVLSKNYQQKSVKRRHAHRIIEQVS